VPLHEFVEGGLGIRAGKLAQQVHVVRIGHLLNYPRRTQKWTNYFSKLGVFVSWWLNGFHT
jgi:hypothetical protein